MSLSISGSGLTVLKFFQHNIFNWPDPKISQKGGACHFKENNQRKKQIK